MDTLGERIKFVRAYFRIDTQQMLAEKLNISHQRIQGLESGRLKQLYTNEALAFQSFFNIDPWWIMSGQKQMFQNHEVATLISELRIPFLDNQGHFLTLDENMLDHFLIEKGSLSVIKVCDDTMFPTLAKNDLCVISSDRNKYKNSGLYVLNILNSFTIRRLYFTADGKIDIFLDNEKYPAKEQASINDSSLKIAGIVVLLLKPNS